MFKAGGHTLQAHLTTWSPVGHLPHLHGWPDFSGNHHGDPKVPHNTCLKRTQNHTRVGPGWQARMEVSQSPRALLQWVTQVLVTLIYSFICLHMNLGADKPRMAPGREFNIRMQPERPNHICANAAVVTLDLRSRLI
jgi:hypothetical protein